MEKIDLAHRDIRPHNIWYSSEKKCYKIGDIVSGKEITSGKLTIRIAEHSTLNDGPPSSASYQEFLDVPLNYLEVLK
jgi:serine/threonine protein kinase